jgi:hypothetical protein
MNCVIASRSMMKRTCQGQERVADHDIEGLITALTPSVVREAPQPIASGPTGKSPVRNRAIRTGPACRSRSIAAETACAKKLIFLDVSIGSPPSSRPLEK